MTNSIDEDARRRFEGAWQARQQPRIEDFLPPPTADSYWPTLEELICIELEFVWKREGETGHGPLVEEYLERFTQLKVSDSAAEASSSDRLLRIIKAEYDVRQEFGDEPSIDEYRRRFPQQVVTGRELLGDNRVPVPPANLVQSLPAVGHVLVETMATADRKSSRYTLSRLHAEGGLGRIWVAHDVNLNRDVALKEIKPETTSHPEVWQRFLKEAQIAGQLEHPNIVPVYELARRPEDDQPFYTMRLVRGDTLRDRIRDFHQRKNEGKADPLELPRLLTAFVSICNAISFAHSKGVIHRDLKPENVVLGAFGEVLVLDWGLAKLTSDKEESPRPKVDVTASANANVTKAGQVLGTPAYMSPEQAAGRISKMDARTDIYGLGAILFETLAGKPPHEGPDVSELLSQIVLAPTPLVRTVDVKIHPALGAICAKAMARDQADRYLTASALADDVQRYLADEPVSVYRAPLLDRAARFLRRHRTMALSGAAALLLVAIVASVAAILINEQKRLVTRAKENEEIAHGETKGALAREAKALKATERELLKANANRLAAQSQELFDGQPQRALLMAVQAAQMCQEAKEQEQPLVRQVLLDHLSRVGGQVLGPITGKNGKPLEMDLAAMSPDGKLIAAASAWRRHAAGQDPSGSKEVFLWHIDDTDPPKMTSLIGPTQEIAALRFNPDGKLLAAPCRDGHVYLWKMDSPETKEPVAKLPLPPPLPNLDPKDTRAEPGAKNVLFSSDGQLLAALYRAGQVRVWKLKDGLPEKEPMLAAFQPGAEKSWPESIPLPLMYFTPDQRRLLTAAPGAEWMLHVWDLTQKSDKPEKSYPLGKIAIRSHARSAAGNKLAVGTMVGEARVYSLSADGVLSDPLVLRHQAGDKFDYNEVEGLAFSPDGEWLISSAVADVRLWNLEDARKASPPRPHGIYPPGRRLTMDPQGAWFALGGDSIAIGLGEGRGVSLHDFPLLSVSSQSSPFTMHVSGSFLWVPGKEGRRDLRMLVTGPRAPEAIPGISRLRGHQNFVVSLATDRLGHSLVSGGRDGMLRVWDTRRADPFAVPHLVPPQWGMSEGCLAPQGGGMLMASVPTRDTDLNTIRLWNLAEMNSPPKERQLSGFHRRGTPFLGPSADGRWLICAGSNKELLVWDFASSGPVLAPLYLKLPSERSIFPRGAALRLSPDSRFVAAVTLKEGRDQAVMVWDLKAADVAASVRTLACRGGLVERIAFSPDSKWLLIGSQDGELKLHHLLKAGEAQEIPLEKDRAGEVTFPRVDQLAIGTLAGRVRFWSLIEQKFTEEFDAHAGAITSLMFWPEHKLTVTVAEGESPRLWQLENGQPTSHVVLPLEDAAGREISISPNGRWLVMAGGNDQPTVFWDLHAADIPHSSVRLFRRWMPGDLVAGFVRFTPDSRHLITIGPTGARYWPLEMDDLVRLAKSAAGRELTTVEKEEIHVGIGR